MEEVRSGWARPRRKEPTEDTQGWSGHPMGRASRPQKLRTGSLGDIPPDLVKAHTHLDALVDKAYGLKPTCTDSDRVAHLFKLYAEKTATSPRP